ncbi:polyphosphate kinase 1 [bacterium]|nr:polyphosphate kinase 1 [bacterium]MCP5461729.1 polyphosphate kinase 1 [bacterium]
MELLDKKYYINRELSWLSFNARVLEEAADPTVPLLDRLKFISIFSSNLDEFFMVRVAAINQQMVAASNSRDPSGLTPAQQLAFIRKRAGALVKQQYSILTHDILVSLEKQSIFLLNRSHFTPEDTREIRSHFLQQIYPVLTPMAIDQSHPFPLVSNCSIELAILLKKPSSEKLVHALVEVPKVLPRFIELTNGSHGKGRYFALLEDIILTNLDQLFPQCEILSAFPFRITRDMDFTLNEDGVADLLVHLEKTLLTRKRREPIRLEITAGIKHDLKQWLVEMLELPPESLYTVQGPLDLTAFFELIRKLNTPALVEEEWAPADSLLIDDTVSVFESISKAKNIPLFHPFQSFDPVVRFLEEASEDPNVLAIKQTLYRVSGDSPVVHALQRAAENGKQVTVIVELKARFDEERNITWARQLEESGAHVIYGIAGLKIHCKALLIIRRSEGTIQRYLHLSTGNYNDKTAKVYTDISYFTDNPSICADISTLFNVMTGYSEFHEWEKIAAAPFNLREKFIALIEREARLSTPHRPGHIIAKMNSLVDPYIIAHLHHAALKGVKIDLLVRGICCLRPGYDTRTITVTSIVDRFLEHSRIFYFANGGNPEYFLSSADWMPRNLDRRIELLFPVEDQYTRKLIDELFRLQLKDKVKGRTLDKNGKYLHAKTKKTLSSRSQELTWKLFDTIAKDTQKTKKLFTIFDRKTKP